mmetsp:Transcript_16714/g.23055  ORF Transcript_16714/g.23055 Transcript_16714/m.23055 type:complete len:134 (-) Transcript_16714:186-587(-)|eukprot:CAMPEP_0196573632 /NCGR_PEP_ID=MMETSP1081-20130531/3499_1 /TAXON_ID=36882 /ORGANISM="Pyramimonas amylifera, Strain CCMP720" /LENGTH=133 /DNA_ID=CAMNT_0041891411 /DNA_START=61 /DNA_END=462 /DNA_ORIENTATION=+
MPFKRHIEIGRVAVVNYGKEYGTLVVIVDVLDQHRVLVDSPTMVRAVHSMRRLALTDLSVKIQRIPKKTALVKALQEADIFGKFGSCSWGQKIAVQKAKKSLDDFGRYKLMVARVKKSAILKREVAKLKKTAK